MPEPTAAELFAQDDGPSRDLVSSYARKLLEARAARAEADQAAAALFRRAEQAEAEFLRALDAASLLSVRLDDGTLLSASSRSSYSVTADALESEAFRGWLRAAGGSSILKHSVHPQTFSAFCREAAVQGVEMHPLIKVFTRRVVSVKKG